MPHSKDIPSPPSLTADAESFITWCKTGNRGSQFFIDRLGLPQQEHEKNRKNRPVFSGSPSTVKHCDALYQASRKAVDKPALQFQFKTKEDFYNVAVVGYHDMIPQVTKPLLSMRGTAIWGSSEPYATIVNEKDYPRHLKYDDDEDHERIMLYLFCWIVVRLFRRLPVEKSRKRTTSAHTGRHQKRREYDPLSTEEDESDYGATNGLDIEGIQVSQPASRNEAGPTSRNEAGPTSRIEAGPTSTIPVAQTTPQSSMSNGTHTAPYSHNAEADSDDDSDQSTHGLFAESSTRQIKRWDCSTTVPAKRGNKRRLNTTRKTACTQPSRLEAAVISREDGSHLNGDRPTTTWRPPIPANDTMQSNFREPTSRGRGYNGVSQSSAISDEDGVHTNGGSTGSAVFNLEDDVDSVQGSPRASAHTTRPTASKAPGPDDRPRLVVPLRVGPPSQDLENLRQRLASKLLDILSAGLRQPSILLLTDTVDIMERIWKADQLRLENVFGTRYNRLRGVFTQWLQCVKGVVEFCTLTGFSGDVTTRDAFLQDLSEELSEAAVKAFIHARGSVAQWRSEPDWTQEAFGRDIASVLLDLASWGGMMRPSMMENLTSRFTGEVLAWF